MTLEDFLIIICLVLAVAFRVLYQYFSCNVWLRYNKKCRHRLDQNRKRRR